MTTKSLLTGLVISAVATYIIYKLTHPVTWKIGDILQVLLQAETVTYTVTGIDTTKQIYGLSPGIWPDVGTQVIFTFAELKALNPVLVGHVEIP